MRQCFRALRRSLFILVVGLMVLVGPEPSPAQPPDAADRDYREELPRIPPKEPAAAAPSFHVAPGFHLETVATEPQVQDPVALTIDEHSRLYVAEMRDYSEQDKESLGVIRLLEDGDGDGRYEKSTVFAEGLSWPTAIHCFDGGVFVGAPPEVYYLKDHDGDGKADERRLVFTGFHRSNVQGLLNCFRWGLDNRLHAATSSSGADVVTIREGKPAADTPPLPLRGRDFAFHPRTLELAATSGGAQHGMSFDEWGDKFVCSNSDHLQMVMFEDRYVARNPYFAAPGPRVSIAADGPQADVFRTSPVEPWRIVRTRLRMKGIVPGIVEGGGRAAGYFTGATGVTIYTGNAWPQLPYPLAIVGDVGSNLVHRKKLEPQGVAYVGRRIDDQQEFVSSSDIWFRPVQFANAPDGSLYILDMYREVIEHPASLPPPIKKHLDLTSGRDRGRIYRIVPDGFQQPPPAQLGKATTAELVATLAHTNGWHRETAARLLFERQDRAAIPLLEKLAAEASLPQGRMHAFYALDGLQALSPSVILRGLQDPHPRVRQHAVRLAEKLAGDAPTIRERLLELTDDESLRVRYQLAFSLGELDDPRRIGALATLVRRDGETPYFRTAIFSSLGTGAGRLLELLAADADYRRTPAGQEWLKSLAQQVGKQQRPEDVTALLSALRSLPAGERATFQAIVQGLAAPADSPLERQVAAATGGRAEAYLAEMLAEAAQVAQDAERPLAQRLAAISQLRLGKLDERADLFAGLLQPAQPADVQAAAITTLGTFPSPAVAELLLNRWPQLSPRLRTMAADVLFSREPWLNQLLTAILEGRIAPADLEPGRIKLLSEHREPAVRELARKALATNQVGSREEVLKAYQSVLELTGDASRGKEVFKRVCAACHQLEGVGHVLGPNLAAVQNRGAEAVLTNVLVPNREVNPQYLNYLVVTADGRTLTGMIGGETATSLTLKRAENATDTVLRIDIDELRSTGQSLMPEGLEKQINPQEMADLLQYLQSIP